MNRHGNQELALAVLWEGVDKSVLRAAIGSFCSSGVISTGNNSTPAPEVMPIS